MRSLLLSFVLATTAAYGQRVSTPSDDGNFGQCGGRVDRSFRGLGNTNKFCDRFAPLDKTGNWFCINGDGTQPFGSMILTKSGNASTAASTTCTSPTAQTFGTTTQYSSPSVPQSANGVTACVVVSMSNYTGSVDLLAHGSFGGGTYSVALVTSGGGINMISKNSSATVLFSSGFAPSLSTWHVICGSYSSADGIARSFSDGVFQFASGAQSPTTLASVTTPWVIGPSAVVPYSIAGAFMTETRLSDARIAQLSRVCQ